MIRGAIVVSGNTISLLWRLLQSVVDLRLTQSDVKHESNIRNEVFGDNAGNFVGLLVCLNFSLSGV